MQKNMDINASDLEFILVLIRSKTLTAAARALGLEQSTISRQLSALEDRFGHPLFARSKLGLVPNSQVQNLIPWAEKLEILLRSANKSQNDLQNDNKLGEVHINAPDVIVDYILAPEMGGLLTKHPSLSLKLTASSQLADMNRLDCDIVVRIGSPPKGQAVFVKLGQSSMGFYGNKKFISEGRTQSIRDLPLLRRQEITSKEELWLNQVSPKGTILSANRMTTCLIAAQAGAGVIFLPNKLGQTINGLVRIPVEEDPAQIEMPIFLASPQSLRRLKRVDITWNWMRQIFKTRFKT